METFSALVANKGEAYSFKILDGFGRTIASASDHPATTGTNARFDAQRTAYDKMGRVIKTSNPAETSAGRDDPAGWELVDGDDGIELGLHTIHLRLEKSSEDNDEHRRHDEVDNVRGLRCAGGEVATLNDEGTIVNNTTKTRQKKIYTDVLGRTF